MNSLRCRRATSSLWRPHIFQKAMKNAHIHSSVWAYIYSVTVRTISSGWSWQQHQEKSPTCRKYVVHVVISPHLDHGYQLMSFTRIMSDPRASWPFLVFIVSILCLNILTRSWNHILLRSTHEFSSPKKLLNYYLVPDNDYNTKRVS